MKNILYPTIIQKDNLGDTLINGLLVRELSKSSVVYLKGTPNPEMDRLIHLNNPYSKNIKILNINKQFFLFRKTPIFYALLKIKFSYVFDTPGHISIWYSMPKTIQKAIFEIFKIIVYKFFGVKRIKYGISLGPFRKIEWKLQQIISKMVYLIGVRDNENFELLKKMNFKNITSVPDLAFLLFENQGLLEDLKTEKTDSITISLRSSLHGKYIDEEYLFQTIQKTIMLVQRIKIEDPKIATINIAYQVDCDQVSMKKIEAQVINNFKDLNIKVLDKLLNFDTAVKLFSSSKYVITNRLHVFLIAMNVGTKTFIVTDIQNHRKLISIVSDLNLQSLIFNEGSKHSLISENEMEIFKLDAFNNKNELVNNITNLFK